jgi:hypothetical protein
VSDELFRIPRLKFTPIGRHGLLVAVTPVGEFQINPRAADRVWAMIKGGTDRRVSSIEEAELVTQAWFAERMREWLVPVDLEEIELRAVERERQNRAESEYFT